MSEGKNSTRWAACHCNAGSVVLEQSMSPICHRLESNFNYFNAQLERLDMYLDISPIQ